MKKLIPNGITTLSLFSGVVAYVHVMYGVISDAYFWMITCLVLDALDGYLARKLNAVTAFGRIYDLLVDFLVFGTLLVVFVLKVDGVSALTVGSALFFTVCHIVRVYRLITNSPDKYTGAPDTVNAIGILWFAIFFGTDLPIRLYWLLLLHHGIAMVVPVVIMPKPSVLMDELLVLIKRRRNRRTCEVAG